MIYIKKLILGVIFTVLLAVIFALPVKAATVVFVDKLLPNWDEGVFSAYVGPPDYGYVSPGTTAVYNGREAGIIKAGINEDADGHYWDEGLFAFQPNVTIDTFAAGTLTYDVVNQYGENPVWMTIEIDTGVVDVRSDNTIYQYVPTTNLAGWHTVDARAGQWQKWNNGAGEVTGNPLMSLSAVADANTGLNVVRAYLRLGMGDSYHGTAGMGTVAWVDKATFGGVTYDFVVRRGNSTPGIDRYLDNPGRQQATEVGAQCDSGAGSGAFGYFGKDLNMAGGADGTQTGINNSSVCGNRP